MVEAYSNFDLAELIDHSLLNPIATPEQIAEWCDAADRFGFATVCLYPIHVRQAVDLLHNKRPKVCTVVGFPSGASTSAVKFYEAQEAVENGATELDVMMNLGWLKQGKTDAVHRELAEICESTGQLVKAILETHLLTDAEKALAAEVCMDAGVAFLQTNTGLYGRATVADVQLLQSVTKGQIGIKAASGIHTVEQAIELILVGATRLGTSYGPELVRQRDTLEKERKANF
jgi:deoxyribose-phosphate aldolase